MNREGRFRSKLSSAIALFLFALAPALPAQSLEAQPSVLTVMADQWYPINGDPDADRPGLAIEMLQAIFEPMGIQVDYRLDSWSRSLEMARNGQVDCVIGAYRSDAPYLLYPQTPVAIDEIAFFVAQGSDWHFHDLSSLESVTLGIIGDYSYGERVDAYLAERRGSELVQTVHGVRPLERNLQKLLSGRIDVLIESTLVMKAMLETQGLQSMVVQAGSLGQAEPVFLACTPMRETTAALLSRFDEGMAELNESGELERILARYGLSSAPATSVTPD